MLRVGTGLDQMCEKGYIRLLESIEPIRNVTESLSLSWSQIETSQMFSFSLTVDKDLYRLFASLLDPCGYNLSNVNLSLSLSLRVIKELIHRISLTLSLSFILN